MGFLVLFLFFQATPVAIGSSQARGQIRVAAAGLCHSHRNAGLELHLQPKLQLAIKPTERGQDLNLHPRGYWSDSQPDEPQQELWYKEVFLGLFLEILLMSLEKHIHLVEQTFPFKINKINLGSYLLAIVHFFKLLFLYTFFNGLL